MMKVPYQEAVAKGHPGPGLLLLLRVNLTFTEIVDEHPAHGKAVQADPGLKATGFKI